MSKYLFKRKEKSLQPTRPCPTPGSNHCEALGPQTLKQ